MTHAPGKYADFEGLREKAVALRRAGLSRRQIRDRLHVDNNDILNRLLEGEPPPAWTKRPNAKDDLREKARELRLQGWTYDQIQVELGCSKSSISLWVRDLPKPERRDPSEQAKLASRKRWEHELAARDEERQKTKVAAAAEIGRLSDRELFLAGVVLYWAEGAKDKTHSRQRRENLQFINSDVAEAESFWAKLVDVDASDLQRTTLKKHNPRTVRKNVGDSYRGCLAIYVTKSAELYRRMEGAWYGIVGATPEADLESRT